MPVRLRQGGIRAVVMVVAALVLGLSVVVVFNGPARATDSNQVDFWCEEGVKIEPIGAPSYTVPQPPDGFTWTLLVIKSATDNEVFPNPVPGQSYTPSNGHDVSHVILCMEPVQVTTTTTTTAPTTTSTDPTTTTTAPATTTTTTAPTTTTTTTPRTVTTLPPDPPMTTSTLPPDPPPTTSTLPPDTTTTEPPPEGGVSAGGGATAVGGAEFAVLWLVTGALALLSGVTLLAMKRSPGRE